VTNTKGILSWTKRVGGDWVDEYYTIYPDTVSVRKATLYTSEPDKFNEWHEAIPLVGAGTIPEDNIHLEAIALTDTQGNHQIYSWEEGFPHSFTDGLSIMLVRLKGEQMPFVITESKGVWVDEVSTPDDHRFNHYDGLARLESIPTRSTMGTHSRNRLPGILEKPTVSFFADAFHVG